jgi:pyruvate/2-oxoacid:ferredoxin oxidoreductase beta subunit
MRVNCDGCEKLPGELNHPYGMIFVGWGHGWQWCQSCGGSGLSKAAMAAFEADPAVQIALWTGRAIWYAAGAHR